MRRHLTLCGVAAVLIWSTGSALCHTLTEEWGILSGALVNLIAGTAAVLDQYRLHQWRFLRGRNLRDWLLCGTLYVIYVAANYGSSLFAVDREQVMALSLIKSAWPILAYVFLFLLQRRHVGKRFLVKVSLLAVGLFISNMVGEDGSLIPLEKLMDCLPAICIGLLSSVAWALYSNAVGMLNAEREGDCTGIFMLAAACIVAPLSLFDSTPYSFSATGIFWGQLLFNSLIGVWVANILWNRSLTGGNRAQIFSFSNLLPVFSVIMSAGILGVKVTGPLFWGSILVVVGTVINAEPKKEKALPNHG